MRQRHLSSAGQKSDSLFGRMKLFGRVKKWARGSARGQRPQRHFETLESRQVLAAANLVISEFMASNNNSILDEDNDRVDWIEIHNSEQTAVNLADYYLTDAVANPLKWRFPNRSINPAGYQVVFASSKNRAPVTGNLHTNFNLAAGGEYLALVYDDPAPGVAPVVVHSFTPSYPGQVPDVSYGFNQTSLSSTPIGPATTGQYLVPSVGNGGSALGTTWTQPGFTPVGWTTGGPGLGFDAGGELNSAINTNVSAALQNVNSSLYARYEFPGINPSTVSSLKLDLNWDDGYVAYLNGTEVSRRNAPASPTWNSTATGEHGGILAQINYNNFQDNSLINRIGSAVIAGTGASTKLRVTGTAGSLAGAAWYAPSIPFQQDFTFSTNFSFNIHTPGGGSDGDGLGADGMVFVIQADGNTRIGGAGGAMGLTNGSLSQYVAFEIDTWQDGSFDPDATMPTHIGINTHNGFVARAPVPRMNGGVEGAEIRYVWIDYVGATDQVNMFYSATNVKPAAPTVTATVDFNAIFPGFSNLIAGWTAGTGGATNAHDVLSWNFTSGGGEQGAIADTFDLTANKNLLSPTGNVLAIHGLNLTAADNDFVIKPRLSVVQVDPIQLATGRYFRPATPGAANGIGMDAPSVKPTLSNNGGIFANDFPLTITAAPGSAIFYTTNGSVPTLASIPYTGPINITATTRIRAIAVSPGRSASEPITGFYIKTGATMTNFQSNLPIVVIDSYGIGGNNPLNVGGNTATTLSALDMANVGMVIVDPGLDGTAYITDAPDYVGRTGLRHRGQTSQGFAKRHFALETRDEYDQDEAVSLLGMPSESDWILNNPFADKSMLQNALAFQWGNEMGHYAPRTRFVEVFVNGDNDGTLNYTDDYVGIYMLVEKIKVDNNRVDIDAVAPSATTEPAITGGYLWKKDKPGANETPWTTNCMNAQGQTLAGCTRNEFRLHDPDDSEIIPVQKTWLINHINEMEAALFGPDWLDPAIGYRKFIDVESWVDLFIIKEFTKEIDGYRISSYYHKDIGGKIKMGPIWDFNLSLSNANYLQGAYSSGWYWKQLNDFDLPYFRRLLSDPSFYQAIVDRWTELRKGVFATDKLLADVDRFAALLSNNDPGFETPTPGFGGNPLSRNFTRYSGTANETGSLASYTWPNCYYGTGDCPADKIALYGTPNTYAKQLRIMKDFITERVAWIDTHDITALEGIRPTPPTYSEDSGLITPGTSLTMTASSVTNFTDTSLVVQGDPAKAIVPTAAFDTAVTTTWRTAAFDDTATVAGINWAAGPTGVGYDRLPASGGDYTPQIGIDVLNQLDPTNSGTVGNQTVYVRVPFNFSGNMANVDKMFLRINFDDGFVAFLNGTEISRSNVAAGALAWNSAAAGSHDAAGFQEFDVSAFRTLLQPGNNLLAIHALNFLTTSSDQLLVPELYVRDEGAAQAAPIYYTTDGTDPRAPSGGISPTAVLYNGAVTLNANTRVIARTFTSNKWSGPADETYTVDPLPLVITEMDFNPAAPSAAEVLAGYGNDDFEFVEFKNIGLAPLNLNGVHFTAGIGYTFGNVTLNPGAHTLLVRNQPAFEMRHGVGRPISGVYVDNLANDGERVTLLDSLNGPVLDFAYDDNWYPQTDGNGYSLVIVNPLADRDAWGTAAGWRPSNYAGGSPGTGETGIAPVQNSVRVNEVSSNSLALSDRFELYNSSTASVDISGFYLTDDPLDVDKYRLPTLPALAPGEHRILTADALWGNTLNLSVNGGTLILTGADGAGLPIGWQVNQDYEAADPNKTLGKYLKSDGSFDFVEQVSTTLGAVNSPPRIGPITINEVMYHPPVGGDEWIELTNITAAPVSLNGWTMARAVDFAFPNVSLDPGAYLLVVAIDPAAFRTKYSIPASVQIVGPYTGVLDDNDANGEHVELRKPGSDVASVLVDRVTYLGGTPWPNLPNGGGQTLAKLGTTLYSNDVINWATGSPGGTPGSVNTFYDSTPPIAPASVTATPLAGNRVLVEWTPGSDPESGIASYVLFRNGAPFQTLPSTTLSFIDTVTLSQPFTYQVLSTNTQGVPGLASQTAGARLFTISSVAKTSLRTLTVVFTEPVTQSSAETLSNYILGTINITNVVWTNPGTTVVLTTDADIVDGNGYRLSVNNLVGTNLVATTPALTNAVSTPGANLVFTPGLSGGLLGSYYDYTTAGTPPGFPPTVGPLVLARVDAPLTWTHTWISSPPALPSTTMADTFAVRWEGRIKPSFTEAYQFQTNANDGARLWIDLDNNGTFDEPGERILDRWTIVAAATLDQSTVVNLVGGQKYNIRLDYFENTGLPAVIRMDWKSVSQTANAYTAVPLAFLEVGAFESTTPTITSITAASSSWTAPFQAALAAAGLGVGGVSSPLGGTSAIMPWAGMNQISVRFSEDVNLTQSSVTVAGVNVPSYGITGFSYNPATYTGTWTLNQALASDRVTVTVAGGIADLVGNVVSGSRTTTILSLPGDVERDGDVDQADFRANLDQQFLRSIDAAYSALHDVTGDGAISIADWQAIRQRQGSALPPPSPAAPEAAGVVALAEPRVRQGTELRGQRQRGPLPGSTDGSTDRPQPTDGQAATRQTLRASRTLRSRLRTEAIDMALGGELS